VVARDGAEVLDYLFATGRHEGRDLRAAAHPAGPRAPQGRRAGGPGAHQGDEPTRLLPTVILTSSGGRRTSWAATAWGPAAACASRWAQPGSARRSWNRGCTGWS
jgi:hypothetical protein